MGIFNKKPKPEPVVEYSPVEQGVPPPAPIIEPDKHDQILANQQIIVQNQQVILNEIIKTQKLLLHLADAEEESPAEPEPVVKKTKLANRKISAKN